MRTSLDSDQQAIGPHGGQHVPESLGEQEPTDYTVTRRDGTTLQAHRPARAGNWAGPFSGQWLNRETRRRMYGRGRRRPAPTPAGTSRTNGDRYRAHNRPTWHRPNRESDAA